MTAASSGTLAGSLVLLLGATLVVAAYFVPTVVAFARDARQANVVLVLNLFLGWSLVGWVVALALACGERATPTASQSDIGTATDGAAAPAGWYCDPSTGGPRWWDGHHWCDPSGPRSQPVDPPPKNPLTLS